MAKRLVWGCYRGDPFVHWGNVFLRCSERGESNIPEAAKRAWKEVRRPSSSTKFLLRYMLKRRGDADLRKEGVRCLTLTGKTRSEALSMNGFP